MFIRTRSHYNKHGNCKLFLVNPRYTVLFIWAHWEPTAVLSSVAKLFFIYSQYTLKCKCLLWIFWSIFAQTPLLLLSCLLSWLDLIFHILALKPIFYTYTFFPIQYNKPSDLVVPEMVNGLQDNLDVVVSLAERHYYNCDFKMCYKLTSM